jgi:hypothetical protein
LLVWSLDINAFGGLGERAPVGNFVYLAINGAVANVPADIPANSQIAHMTVAAEFLTGAVLIGSLVSLLFERLRTD